VLTSAFSEPIRLWLRPVRRLPVLTRAENSSGPEMPPAVVPIAKKKAIASARVSIGKTSLTVSYAELAPAEAKNSAAHQHAVIVVAFSEPVSNR
jgi:hypothetical protein